jgi:hypothetical protein
LETHKELGRTFHCHRRETAHFLDRSTEFLWYEGWHLKYTAKFTKAKSDMPIFAPGSLEVGQMTYRHSLSHFTLREFNREILSVRFVGCPKGSFRPRTMKCSFCNPSSTWPEELSTSDPQLLPTGWSLDLGGEYCIPSIKNCRLGYYGIPFVYIRKTHRDILEIESLEDADSLSLFALAIASFLCKL